MNESSYLRRKNQMEILQSIANAGEATAAMIVEATGLSVATVSRGLSNMKENRLIIQKRKDTGELGRRPDVFSINGGYAHCLYFCLAGGALRGYLLDLRGRLVAGEAVQTPLMLDALAFIQALTGLAASLEGKKRSAGPVLLVDIAVPGVVSPGGNISRIPSFPKLENTKLTPMVENALGHPCHLHNISRLSAVGAYLQYEVPVESLVYLDINPDGGIGAGIVLGGTLYEDRNSLAGEVGDMVIGTGAELRSDLGNQGALEQGAGLKALYCEARKLADAGMAPELRLLLEKQELTLTVLEKAASGGELGVYRLLDQATLAWATAIVNICALLSPEHIIVGGAVHQGHKLIDKMLRYHLSRLYHRQISLQLAKKSADNHVVGAAHLSQRHLFEITITNLSEK